MATKIISKIMTIEDLNKKIDNETLIAEGHKEYIKSLIDLAYQLGRKDELDQTMKIFKDFGNKYDN